MRRIVSSRFCMIVSPVVVKLMCCSGVAVLSLLHVDLIDDVFELVDAVIALGYDLVCGVDDFGSVDHVDWR